MKANRMNRMWAFTLTELLVVITIIVLFFTIPGIVGNFVEKAKLKSAMSAMDGEMFNVRANAPMQGAAGLLVQSSSHFTGVTLDKEAIDENGRPLIYDYSGAATNPRTSMYGMKVIPNSGRGYLGERVGIVAVDNGTFVFPPFVMLYVDGSGRMVSGGGFANTDKRAKNSVVIDEKDFNGVYATQDLRPAGYLPNQYDRRAGSLPAANNHPDVVAASANERSNVKLPFEHLETYTEFVIFDIKDFQEAGHTPASRISSGAAHAWLSDRANQEDTFMMTGSGHLERELIR